MDIDWAIFKDSHLGQIIATVAAVVLLPIIKAVIRKISRQYAVRTGKPMARVRQVRYVIAALININFVIVVAMIWSVDPQNLFVTLSTVLAFLGVALFAQWSVLSNITAGIVIFFSAPYHMGNAIRIIDKDIPLEATIERIGAFYTHLRTTEGELVVLPNNLFLQKVVGIK
jgi:small-conductance mechanosensitive channel